MCWFRSLALSLLTLVLTPSLAMADFEEDYESKQWQEVEVALPAAPKEANLQPFYVSAATSNRFFIDISTLSVGSDGVVRYVLLVLSPEGGRNVTFEGMRCESRERRIYASGRQDGSWSKARKNEWVRIQDAYANRHHAALFLDYFCPFGNIVRDAAEAKKALMLGGHPDNKRWQLMSPDQFILEFDRALRTVLAPARSVRPVPGNALPEAELDAGQKRLVVGLMRVNHCGEICAQALYQGQALTSRDPVIREALCGAAEEETEHLAWTEQRIAELGGRKSLLNPHVLCVDTAEYMGFSGVSAYGSIPGSFHKVASSVAKRPKKPCFVNCMKRSGSCPSTCVSSDGPRAGCVMKCRHTGSSASGVDPRKEICRQK
eukprot:TRINITY_DN1643_c0_g1_i22.p1 TRINITY_DN1643_c0_g1~~TRINITY_DN1643_c0_g1_i22.p1  ORF type:complete len:375 (+),score=-17.75 TRINITY_DN1643_c0_g1_i22:285-1409(+)